MAHRGGGPQEGGLARRGMPSPVTSAALPPHGPTRPDPSRLRDGRRAHDRLLHRVTTSVARSTLARGQIDAPMACQGRLGSGSSRRLVICLARCSALVRDRPVVVMTLRLPRRSRMSQACPGGRPRELVEPVSIWTVTGGMAGRFRGLERDSAPAGLLWLRTRQGRAAPGGGGQALSRSRGQQAWMGRGRPTNRSKASKVAAAD